MALQRVEMAAPPPETKTTGKRKGWGGIGSKIGTVAGAVVGGVAGYAASGGNPAGAAMGAAGGATTGANFGNMLGEGLKRSSEGTTTAIDRRMAQTQSPEQGKAAQLRESLMALSQAPVDVKKQYGPELLAAYMQTLPKQTV